MRRSICALALAALFGGAACSDKGGIIGPSGPQSGARFFVTSSTSVTGNLGGLAGADNRCQTLAAAVGLGDKTWRAYLSVDRDPSNGNRPTNARDRIGVGPWTNVMASTWPRRSPISTRAAATPRFSSTSVETGSRSVAGLPAPVQHDILTGTNADGTLLPRTHVRRLDARFGHAHGASRSLRRPWAGRRCDRRAVVLELIARQPELLEHRAARRGRTALLFRDQLTQRD